MFPLAFTGIESEMLNYLDCPRRNFPFRKQAMPFLTVDAIIGNQAFKNERCYIFSSLGLDKVRTDFNLLMELKCTHQMINFSYSLWFACG